MKRLAGIASRAGRNRGELSAPAHSGAVASVGVLPSQPQARAAQPDTHPLGYWRWHSVWHPIPAAKTACASPDPRALSRLFSPSSRTRGCQQPPQAGPSLAGVEVAPSGWPAGRGGLGYK